MAMPTETSIESFSDVTRRDQTWFRPAMLSFHLGEVSSWFQIVLTAVGVFLQLVFTTRLTYRGKASGAVTATFHVLPRTPRGDRLAPDAQVETPGTTRGRLPPANHRGDHYER